jgi:peptidyl-prolyl cis-trans isomerase C
MRFRPALLAACLVPAFAGGIRPSAAQTPAPSAAPSGPPLGAPAGAPSGSPAGSPPAAASSTDENPLLARVDGQEVRMSDVVAVASEVLPPELRGVPPATLMQMLPPEVSRQLVDRAITERALVAAARGAGLDRDEEVKRRMRRAEDQELQQALLTREVGSKVTDEAIRARYDQEAAKRQGEPEVHARHILVATEAAAKDALAEVAKGADFAEVAKRRSTDPGGKQGGDLGFFKRGDMVPEFAEAAFALQPGQVSAAPVKSPFGWHVIKVEERRAASAPSFEEAKPQIQRQMLEEGVEAMVQRVRAAAKVERLDSAAAPVPAGSLLDNAAPPPNAGGPPPGRAPAPPPTQQRR